MKIRLAKKIMKQGHCCSKKNLSFHWMRLYWVVRWNRLDMQTWNIKPELKCKVDHRITKAISLTSKISTIVDTSKKKKHENTK